jgi:hypothetical protein
MYDGPVAFTFHSEGEDLEVVGAAENNYAALDSRVGIFSSEFGKQLWDPPSIPPRVRGRDLGLRDAQWQTGNPEDDDQVQEDVLQLMKDHPRNLSHLESSRVHSDDNEQ